MNWAREFMGVALILAASVAIIVPVEWWARRTRLQAEMTRKLMHLAGVVPCLFIPVLIHSTLVAVVLAAALAVVLWAGSRFGCLRSVSEVARRTHGAMYYPLAILTAFMLAGDRTWMFLSALLAVGVADAFAALVGSTYGRLRYEVEDGETKSLEGSAVFFGITFAAVALPLLLMAGLPWPICLLAALLTATLATGVEAVSLRGFDNLLVPLAVCITLDRIVGIPWQDLLATNLVLWGLLIGIGAVARMTRQISPGAAIVFVLFTYAASALADWRWALAPVTGFVLYVALRMAVPPPQGYRTRVKVGVPVRMLTPAFLVIAIANATGKFGLLQGPYLACLGAALCFALRVYLAKREALPARVHPGTAALAGAFIGIAGAGPLWLLEHASFHGLVAIAATCALLMVVHEFTLPRDDRMEADDYWTAPRFLLTCTAALTIAGLQGSGLIPSWS